MVKWPTMRKCLIIVVLLLLAIRIQAQQECPLPPAIAPVTSWVNMFSDQQEIDLGDALAESIALRIKVIGDEQLTSHLRMIGNRLVQHLPPTNLKFRFYLVELPVVNAFSIAGGRVYVSRKMVALTQNEDELAGVIAHELGHIVTHQTAIAMTKNFRDTLGINQVGDRADIFAKYHQYLENVSRNPNHPRLNSEEQNQYIADQVAVYITARAGYAPHAFVDLWDRFQETHGKTGNWFSDLFGTTKPSERRLREMGKSMANLPPSCAELKPASELADFHQWRAQVIAYDETSHEASLPGLLLTQKLAPPLRPDISYLRYSPDGKYILAQDEGGIHVLNRDPFLQLFYIPAEDAADASFTPDSKSIVFYFRTLRVETWSIAEQRRTSTYEITYEHPCLQTELSPDGSLLACLDEQLALNLIDVASSKVVLAKKRFYELGARNLPYFVFAMLRAVEGEPLPLVRMQFSPDGKFLLVAFDEKLIYDVANRRESSLPGAIRDLMNDKFTFLGTDRMAGINPVSPNKSPVVRFPSGEHLQEIPLAEGIKLRGSTRGDYLLVRPLKDYAAGALDLQSKRITVGVKNPALDIYDQTLIHEQENGELSLDVIDTQKHLSTFRLPEARLGGLSAAAASSDLNWLAISTRSRGAVWNVKSNIRSMHIRGFHGAWFADDQTLYADMPKFQDTERQIGQLNPSTGGGNNGYEIGDVHAVQHGHYLVITKPKDHTSLIFQNADMEVRDVQDGRLLWSRHFPHELPSISFAPGRIILIWRVMNAGGHDELQHFADLKKGAAREDYLVEIVDLASNSVISEMLIKSNKYSLQLQHAQLCGNWLVATATGNQVLIYFLPSGEEKPALFGSAPVCSANGELMAVNAESGNLKLYGVGSSQPGVEYKFPDPISFKQFSADGKRLLVLTATQNVYILDVATTIPINSASSVVK